MQWYTVVETNTSKIKQQELFLAKANLARLRHNNCGLDYGTINEVDVAEKVDLYALNKRYFSLIITPLFSESKAKFEMEEIIFRLIYINEF